MGDAKNFDEQLYTGDPLTTVKDFKKTKLFASLNHINKNSSKSSTSKHQAETGR